MAWLWFFVALILYALGCVATAQFRWPYIAGVLTYDTVKGWFVKGPQGPKGRPF